MSAVCSERRLANDGTGFKGVAFCNNYNPVYIVHVNIKPEYTVSISFCVLNIYPVQKMSEIRCEKIYYYSDGVDLQRFLIVALAPVVQHMDNAVHQMNCYPVDSVVCFVKTYPLERFIWWMHYPHFKQLGPEYLLASNTHRMDMTIKLHHNRIFRVNVKCFLSVE